MNKILIILLLFCSLTTFGQVDIYNLSLTDSTKNILYRQRSNKIKVSGIKNTSELKLNSNSWNQKLDNSNGNLFFISPRRQKKDTLVLLLKDSIIFKKIFDCLLVPDPIPIFAESKETYVTKEQIKKYPYLETYLPDCSYKNPYIIVRFDLYFLIYANLIDGFDKKYKNSSKENYKLSFKKVDNSLIVGRVTELNDSVYYVDPKTGKTIAELRKTKTKKVRSKFLNKGHLEIINQMQSGDLIIIRNIVVRSMDGADRNLGSIYIRIR